MMLLLFIRWAAVRKGPHLVHLHMPMLTYIPFALLSHFFCRCPSITSYHTEVRNHVEIDSHDFCKNIARALPLSPLPFADINLCTYVCVRTSVLACACLGACTCTIPFLRYCLTASSRHRHHDDAFWLIRCHKVHTVIIALPRLTPKHS